MKSVFVLSALLVFAACNKESEFGEKEAIVDPICRENSRSIECSSGGSSGGLTTGGSDGGSSGGTTGIGGGTEGGTSGGGTTGNNYQSQTDNFQQNNNKKLDILWVVDNSGSMGDEQQALGMNFDIFINSFADSDSDFKMAITTSDPRDPFCGVKVPNSDMKLTSAAADLDRTQFINDFKTMINVGINGSGDERGLQATECFKAKNAAFFRPEAYLIVVEVSDEEDHSPNAVASYVDALKALKPENPGYVKVYSIVDTQSTNVNMKGQRYIDASTASSGEVADIKQNFAGVLSDMGDAIMNLLDSFVLSASPIPGSLKVYVNNQLVPASYYVYDSSSNSVKFNGDHIPALGASIKLTYNK